jgi:coiled-coil domain-containing protein 39
LTAQLNVIQNSIFRGNERMDQFKLEMNWNQEELEQWALAAKQKEEDNIALMKYTRADDAKIKELNLALERMNKDVQIQRKNLEMEVKGGGGG